MTYHIARAGSPINAITYDTRDAAVACFDGAGIRWLDNDRIVVWGLIYDIVNRVNPKTARAAAVAARPAGFVPPTDKQVALVNKLATRVGGGSIAMRVGMMRAGQLDRTSTSRLIDDMLTEARS